VQTKAASASRRGTLMAEEAAKDAPGCPRCGTIGKTPSGSLIENHQTWYCVMCEMEFSYCRACALAWTAPMSPFCRDKHEPPTTYHPFISYFDFALGVEVTSLAERHKHMRNAHVDYRDKLTKGQLAERADRAQQRRQEQDRGHAPGGSNRTSGKVYSR